MKEAEYFQRAMQDPDFRRDKILELREHLNTIRYLSAFMGVLLVIGIIAIGFAEGRWFSGFGSFFSSIILVAWVYMNTATRLRALQAMAAAAEPAASASRSDQIAIAGS